MFKTEPNPDARPTSDQAARGEAPKSLRAHAEEDFDAILRKGLDGFDAARGDRPSLDVYIIANAQGDNFLDIDSGRAPNATSCFRKDPLRATQYWRILPGQPNHCIIQSVATDLCIKQDGRNRRCTFATKNPDDDSQNWLLTPDSKGQWKFASKSDPSLSLDSHAGQQGDNVPVYAWDHNTGENQLWLLTNWNAGAEMPSWAAATIAHWKLGGNEDGRVYSADESYSYVTVDQAHQIWTRSILNSANEPHVSYLREVFDCDDFAITMKALVGRWWYTNHGTSENACSFGIAWTWRAGSGHAINILFGPLWTLSLFEPQLGARYEMEASETARMIMF